MPRFSMSLLGVPQIALDGARIKITAQRLIPLLAYLAITGKNQTRETIASLLWSEVSQKQALASLRTTLWRLKSAGLEDWISIDTDVISINHQKNIDIDVLDFINKIDRCTTHGHAPSHICLYCLPTLAEAANIYRGEFMAGINLSGAQAFDNWRLQESESLYLQYLSVLERLVSGYRTYGDFNSAILYARLWLSQDRYNENAQHDLLQLYELTGQRTSAISQYKHYKDLLSHEFNLEPTEEITSLYKQILSGRSTTSVDQKVNKSVFLIADIDKAELFWARMGEKKSAYLSAYHNLIKETSKKFGGRLLQKSEDNLTLLFENGQPLHCAVTIHLKIKQTDWGDNSPPDIRMVLYSPSVEDGTSSNFAATTRAASDLLSICWGGQILFSEQTLQILDRPSGSHIRDLGFHTLKDIEASFHVFELIHPHLPTVDHLPLQSANQQLVNFPSLSPPFVGRETELSDLNHLIDSPDCRIVSLVGPGGIGKTRLAIQFANQVTKHFPDGIFFISLAPIQDPDLIPIVLADTLKFSFFGNRSYTEQLIEYLHRKKVLLVFDNFEHLKIEGGTFLALLLSETHFLKILVTTRERLNLIAETFLEVHGLPVPATNTTENLDGFSSIKLFLYNAHRISPRTSFQNNLTDIVHICRLVDGLPLGIVLASSWIRVYTCLEIAEQVKKNLDFLATTALDIAPRHRSLRVVFDHSWQLLSEDEQQILAKLSIFRTAFTAHAASQVCAASPQNLTAFVDKSLLNRRSDDRYEMLETFRQYAFGKLESCEGDYRDSQEKFGDYYVSFFVQKHSELNSGIQRQALDEITSEFENIRAAWNWMIDSEYWQMIDQLKAPLLTYLIMVGDFIQGREFYTLALHKLGNLNDPDLNLLRNSMQQAEAWLTVRNGFVSEGLQKLATCLDAYRQFGSPWDIAMTMMYLADGYRILGQDQRGKEYIEGALQAIWSADLPKSNFFVAVTAHCQAILGTILIKLGDLEQARLNLETSLSVHTRLGTHYGTIHPLTGLAQLAYLQGELFKSRDLYLQALETATKLMDQRGMALIHNNLGAVYEDLTDVAASYHHVLSALKLCKETGDRRLSAVILNNLAYHQLQYLRQAPEAIRTYHEAIETFSDLGDLRGIAYTYYDLSKAYLQVGLVDEAWKSCLQSLQTAMTLDNQSMILHTLHGFTNLFTDTEQYERALRLCCLLLCQPRLEADTQRRLIVTKLNLEAKLTPEVILTAGNWGKVTNLQDVIDQLLVEKIPGR